MFHFDFKVNLRFWLRPWCKRLGHLDRPVFAGDAWSRGYVYCERCGKGFRKENFLALKPLQQFELYRSRSSTARQSTMKRSRTRR